MRRAAVERTTKETSVAVKVNLDGTGNSRIATGVGFLDHMLDQLARHSLIDIHLEAKGDLHVDLHHTTEDAGITLGQALARALGERRGIVRYGSAAVPMDEALTSVAVDVSGRPYLAWSVSFSTGKIGDFDTELFREWFRAVAQHAGLTVHVICHYGDNNHHIIESCFKAFARALRAAIALDPRQENLNSLDQGNARGLIRMKHYTVHGRPDWQPDEVMFVKDGFNWPAFLVPVAWLVVKGQWLWLVMYLLALVLVGAVATANGLTGDVSALLVTGLSLIMGLEANDIYRRSLTRRGFAFLGPAAGADLETAELQFFSRSPASAAPAVSGREDLA